MVQISTLCRTPILRHLRWLHRLVMKNDIILLGPDFTNTESLSNSLFLSWQYPLKIDFEQNCESLTKSVFVKQGPVEINLPNPLYQGYKEIVDLLIQKGIDVNAVSDDSSTALIKASKNGRSPVSHQMKLHFSHFFDFISNRT